MFNYYCSALGSPYDLDYSPCINLYTYDTMTVPVVSAETANTYAGNLSSISGAFGIGQELVSFPSANQDQMFSGRNTSSEDIFHNMIFGTGLQYRRNKMIFQLIPSLTYNFREIDFQKSGKLFTINGGMFLKLR